MISWDQGDHDQAIAHLKQAIQVEPRQPRHYNNLGVFLNLLKHHEAAKTYLENALVLDPDYLDAKCNLGLALFHLHNLPEAANCFEQILLVEPGHAAAHANLGLVQLTRHNYAKAISNYQKALAINNASAQWQGNLGAAYAGMGKFDQAAICYQKALKGDPHNLDLKISLSIAFRNIGNYQLSIEILKESHAVDPDNAEILTNLIMAYEQACHWEPLDSLYAQLDHATKTSLAQGLLPGEDPMFNIRRSNNLALNRAVAQTWSQHVQSHALRLAEPFTHVPGSRLGDRITIGYLSYDFRNHPVAHQIHPLFRLHDRQRFKVLAFSMGPDDNSSYRADIQTHSDAFIDIGHCGLRDAAQQIHEHRVDILVDLMGHSRHNRMGILALRPAPLQVGYLGFLSTTGADFIDYLVADDVVVPVPHHGFYSEHLLRMPVCYQLNHTPAKNPVNANRRGDWQLPRTGFVFCCFNVAYKIDRSLFDTWMRILRATPGSVLWLFDSHPLACDHMRARAKTMGIDPERLIFAAKKPLEEHLARLPLADLALDTLRYNGGATTANALSVGLPVLTAIGKHWVSRMSASHVAAAGLPQLVTADAAAYENKAIALAHDPEQLHGLRRRLAQNLTSQPLFDPQAFVRALEAGYLSIWDRYLRGKKPRHIKIPSVHWMPNLESSRNTRMASHWDGRVSEK